jgi:hypothetical protein
MSVSIDVAPLVPWGWIALAAALAAAGTALAAWRGLAGWWLRALGLALLVIALAGPQLRREVREGLPNVGFLVIDSSESTALEDREAQIAEAAETLRAELDALDRPETPLEIRVVEVDDDASGEDRGTRLLSALDEAAASVAPGQVAGAVLLTDGQIHDAGALEDFPGPVHALLAGEEGGFDLALELVSAPGFGVVGEDAVFKLRPKALGAAPEDIGGRVPVELSVDGGAPERLSLPLGAVSEVPVAITHGGPNVVDFALPVHDDELTGRNNRVLAEVNGVRDRLRVLLVSGEPHPGGRTWRDLLKADASVDLIHFTILRPPSKQDGTPVSELSLIAFPTRELFLEKIDGFDLIIFDRYRWRGVLRTSYLANIAEYVREGGAVLLSSGPAFAGAESLARTPLAEILPAEPTLEVVERPFLPRITDLGARHPVTAGLGRGGRAEPDWGRWLRQVRVEPRSGDVVMSGADGLPLLILDRVGEGRVALIASDHAWLWTRGHEGGGPQAGLLRRTAHWLMKEPELEEEALFARVDGTRVVLERRTLAEDPPARVAARPPSGEEIRELDYAPAGPGRYRAVLEGAEEGLWRFSDAGGAEAVAAVGPPSPKEYENPLASPEPLSPLAEATGGSVRWISAGLPDPRLVPEGRRAHSASWIGLERRDAYRVTGIRFTPLLPAWLAALLTALLFVAAWRVEGRR